MPLNLCAYKGCTNSKKKRPDLSFHRFPRDECIQLDWILHSGNDNFLELSSKQLIEKRLCSEHFEKTDFMVSRNKKQLKVSAIPKHASQIELTLDSLEPDRDSGQNSAILPSLVLPNLSAVPGNYSSIQPNPSLDITSRYSPAIDTNIDLNGTPNIEAPLLSNPLSPVVIESQPDQISHQPELLSQTQIQVPQTSYRLTVSPRKKRLQNRIQTLTRKLKVQSNKIRRLESRSARQTEIYRQKPPVIADILKSASHYLEGEVLLFFEMQLRHTKRSKWTEVEKQFALSLYYKSPSAYVFLRDVKKFLLPCVTLVRRWINELQLTTGINQGIFDRLQKKTLTMTKYERECVLLWDEMSIRTLLEYNSKADVVEGYQDLGSLGRTRDWANHALVFMLRGLKYPWKQPIAYVVLHGSISSNDLTLLITDVITAVIQTGLLPKSVTCDQGPTNRRAVANLGVTEASPFFTVMGRKIFFTYDVPHLIKSIRNNLHNKDFVIDGEVVSWVPIRELREIEAKSPCRAAPKLTDRHIDPNNFQRMKVSLATQVFSGSVSAAITTAVFTGDLKHSAGPATARFIKNMNDLFDCLNSRNSYDPNPLKRALSSKQPQVENYLQSAVAWLKTWKTSTGPSPPCFSGLILTVKSVLQLWQTMHDEGSLYLPTAHLNQDTLENLFAILRSRCGHNDNPSSMQFRRNLQYAMTVNLMKPPSGTNCERDDATSLFATFSSEQSQSSSTLPACDDAPSNAAINLDIDNWVNCDDQIRIELPETVDNTSSDRLPHSLTEHVDESLTLFSGGSLQECAMRYVAGYLAHKCLKKFQCPDCLQDLTKDNQDLEQTSETLIFWKAYSTYDETDLGHLKAPSDKFHTAVTSAYQIFDVQFKQHSHKEFLGHYLRSCISHCFANCFDANHKDSQKHLDFIIALFVRVHIFYNLKWMSKDRRDHHNNKRPPVSAGSKPNRKLQKITHL